MNVAELTTKYGATFIPSPSAPVQSINLEQLLADKYGATLTSAIPVTEPGYLETAYNAITHSVDLAGQGGQQVAQGIKEKDITKSLTGVARVGAGVLSTIAAPFSALSAIINKVPVLKPLNDLITATASIPGTVVQFPIDKAINSLPMTQEHKDLIHQASQEITSIGGQLWFFAKIGEGFGKGEIVDKTKIDALKKEANNLNEKVISPIEPANPLKPTPQSIADTYKATYTPPIKTDTLNMPPEIQPLATKDRFFTFQNDTKQFIPIDKAKGVDVVPNLETFAYKSDKGYWNIIEAKSGLPIPTGSSKTLSTAIENAKSAIARVEDEGKSVQDFVDKSIKENGLSPRYQVAKPPIVEMNITKISPELQSLAEEAKKYKSAEEFVNAQPIVYHGTSANFEAFDNSMRGSIIGAESAKGAIWFTDDPATAEAYSVYASENGVINKLMEQATEAEKVAQKSGLESDWKKYDALIQEMEKLDTYDANLQRRNTLANVKEATVKGDFYTVDAKGKSPQELSADGSIDSWLNQQLDKARKLGKDGVVFKNLDDAVGLYNRPSTHYAIFDSRNIQTKSQLTDFYNQVTGAIKETKIPQEITETKISGVAKSIEAKAIEQGLINRGFDKLAGYDASTIKEQAGIFSDMLNNKGIEGVRAILRGEEPLPERAKSGAFVVSVEEYLQKHPNADLAYELANSPHTSAISQAGSELGLTQNRIQDSFTQKTEEIRKAREERNPIKSSEIKTNIKKEMDKMNLSESDLGKLEKFIENNIC